jgi:hypothetical protein
MLLKCWAISIFAQSVLYCQDYTFNGCRGKANGCGKSAKRAGGAGRGAPGTGSSPKGASGCCLCGLGAKMGSFGIFVHGFDAGGAATGGHGSFPLQGIARGGGRVRNRSAASGGKEESYFGRAAVTQDGLLGHRRKAIHVREPAQKCSHLGTSSRKAKKTMRQSSLSFGPFCAGMLN